MRYRVGKAIAEMTDSPGRTAAVSILVAACAAALEIAAHSALMQTRLSEGVHAALDALIIGFAVGATAWFFFSATRVRRRRVLEHVRLVAELNHHVRNALQVIVGSHYLEEASRAGAVLESVQRIDNALRDLFPAIGERAEDGGRSGISEARRRTASAYILRRRHSELSPGQEAVQGVTTLPVRERPISFSPKYRTPRNRSRFARYTTALVAVSLGLAVALALRPASFATPFLFFYFPVLLAIWYGGFWPGVMATLLSTLFTNYFLLSPYGHFSLKPTDLLRCTFFAAAFVLIDWLIESRRRVAESELSGQISALRASEERLAAIIGTAMDAIITVDDQQRVVVFNAAAEQVFGWCAADAVGQPLDRFLPERVRQVHRQHVEHFGTTGATARSLLHPASLVGLRSNGEEFPAEITISRVDAAGRRFYTAIIRDITHRLQTEQALVQSEKLATVGRLAATVVHEISNPLEAVGSLLYLIDCDDSASTSVRRYAEMAQAEIDRVGKIVKHTLGFSRGGANYARCHLTEVLDNVLSLANRKLEQKAVSCEKQYIGHAEILAVPSEIQQVFWNLLTNAIDAVPPKGRIRLRVRSGHKPLDAATKGVFVTIADNGGGISPGHLARIFEPFYTTKTNGNGLGLWVTKQIVENHNGALRVRSSQVPGSHQGTVFSIFFPSQKQPRTVNSDTAPGEAGRGFQPTQTIH